MVKGELEVKRMKPTKKAFFLDRVHKSQLDAQRILSIFRQTYMFRAYLCPSSGGTTVCIQQLVFIIIFRWLSVVLVGLEQSNQDNRQQTKYTKSKLCIKLVFIYTIVSRCTVSKIGNSYFYIFGVRISSE